MQNKFKIFKKKNNLFGYLFISFFIHIFSLNFYKIKLESKQIPERKKAISLYLPQKIKFTLGTKIKNINKLRQLKQNYLPQTISLPPKIISLTNSKIASLNNSYKKSNILVLKNNNTQNNNKNNNKGKIILTKKENIFSPNVKVQTEEQTGKQTEEQTGEKTGEQPEEQTNFAQSLENNNYASNQFNWENKGIASTNSYSQNLKIKKTKLKNKIVLGANPKKEKQNLTSQNTENIKNSIASYLQLVKNKIVANLTFPEAARQLKMGEKIILNITLSKSGEVKKIKVIAGKNNIFIESAKKIVLNSTPFAKFPKEIADVYNELNINIPINFQLKEEP